MKLFLALFLVASATAGRLENAYLPPNTASLAGGSSTILSTSFNVLPTARLAAPLPASPVGVAVAPATLYAAPVVAYTGPATTPVPILRLNNDINGDGSYRYDYETANHIAAQESGRPVGPDSSEVQGSYSYLAPNGQTITVSYVADENGFRPVGDHLPTPPPIPEAILKSLEINAAEEARGIVDNGQYRVAPSGIVQQQYVNSVASAQYLPPVVQQAGYRY